MPSVSDTNNRSDVTMGFTAGRLFAQEDPHDDDQHGQQMKRQARLVSSVEARCCMHIFHVRGVVFADLGCCKRHGFVTQVCAPPQE